MNEFIKKLLEVFGNEPSKEQTDALTKAMEGVFSDQMTKTVIEAPTERYMIYTFLIIALVLVVAVVMILKITTSSTNKAIKSAVEPYIAQLESFKNSYTASIVEYNNMKSKFNDLKEELIRTQALQTGEEDKVTMLLTRLEHIHNNLTYSLNNLATMLREGEQSSFERHMAIVKMNLNLKVFLTELKFCYGDVFTKDFGHILLNKGFITKDQFDEAIQELLPPD